jgi:ABC-type lipopolysaccharide export system ATPase subunit
VIEDVWLFITIINDKKFTGIHPKSIEEIKHLIKKSDLQNEEPQDF